MKKISKSLIAFALCASLFLPALVLAQTKPGSTVGTVNFQYENVYNPLATVKPAEVIGRVINFVLSILGSFALLLIVFAGFTWMTAAGNDTKIKTARNIMMWTTAGIVVIFFSYVLVRFVFQLIGK